MSSKLNISNIFREMIRRLLTNVLENTLQPLQTESTIYQSPFTKLYTSHLSWLTSASPCFSIQASNITILSEPRQFYDTLLQNCATASRRITLVSLYLGNGGLEQKLVQSLMNNQNFTNGKLKINILLDHMRASRYENNSRRILMPLLEKKEENCNVSLYHTPTLRGLRKKFAPHRWNELFGLQHMKLYIFDDTLIISGANLSNDYFTNRQDRYFIVRDKTMCDFYDGLVNKVQQFSLRMDKSNNLVLNLGWNQLPYEGSKAKFVDKASDMIENYLMNWKDDQNVCKREGCDTWIFPLVQMGQLGIEQDSSVTARLLAEAPFDSRLFIATGYFNLTRQYMNTIMHSTKAKCKLLMAHPNANGFQGASFPAGGIPAAYSLIAQRFTNNLRKLGQSSRVTLQEYLREGWTYHAKGLWYYPPDQSTPCLTLIGSPNFGERSVKRDLETQLAIVTENKQLRENLHNECKRLYELGLPLDNNRMIPKWVYPMVYFFRGFF